jgi:uncharacterized damage-inducible protein DinB
MITNSGNCFLMNLKDHLADMFRYNEAANIKLLTRILQLPDATECTRLFSHLVNCQFKWLARIRQLPGYHELSWWDPVYPGSELEHQWRKSIARWLAYLETTSDEELEQEVQYRGDEGMFAATPKDIALQLNYHSIHHRAQMQLIIRSQGLEPDFLDYIGTKFRKLG